MEYKHIICKKKLCSKCEIEKDIWEFAFRNKPKGIRRTECKVCQRKIVKEHYKKNKEVYLSKSKQYRRRLLEKVNKIKEENPCTDCGDRFHYCQMDFDHLDPTDKNGAVSTIMRHAGIKRTMAEIKNVS